MKNLKIAITLSLLFSQFCYAEYFKHLGVSDGLHQVSVMCIYQDTLGRMWFGTKEGISVYDGKEMFPFRASVNEHLDPERQLLIGNDIYTIQGNDKGDVFVIADFRLLKYDIRKETFKQITSGNTRALAAYDGKIWVAMNNSIYLFNDETEELEFIFKTDLYRINWLTVTNGAFYIGSTNGLYIVDKTTYELHELIPAIDVYRIFESSTKEIWVGCRMEGLYRIDTDGKINQVTYTPGRDTGIMNEQIREFVEDDEGNIWFGTFEGLQKYDPKTRKYAVIRLKKNMGGLEHPSVFSLSRDRQGTIWIGTYYGGVNYFNPKYDAFSRFSYKESVLTDLYFSYIGDILLDKKGNLWIGTDGGGMSCLDKSHTGFRHFHSGGANSLPHNNIKSLAYDEKRHTLYIGTYIGGICKYDIQKDKFYNYIDFFTDESTEPNGFTNQIVFKNDRLYIAARNGVFTLDPETNKFQKVSLSYICRTFDVDSNEDVWMALGRTLACVDPEDQKQKVVLNLEDRGCFFDISQIRSTKNGVYVATLGGGVFYYDKTTQKIENYSVQNNYLLSNYCYNLAETNLGNILVTSDKGIDLLSPVSNEVRSVPIASGYPAPAILHGCGVFVASDGLIFVGDVDGITFFRENDLNVPGVEQQFYFSGLSVNNRKIQPGDETGILNESLPFTDKLNLRYDQNNFIVSFSSSNYVDLFQHNLFEYKLDGFDKEWVRTDKMEIQYTNLNPGKYTLHVRKKSNMPGKEYEDISQFITISSPWYNTCFAWFMYILIASICIYFYIRMRETKRKLALSLEKERFEKGHIESMNHAKLLFFTNVSHEFRTPLTLIISHVELLLENMSISPVVYDHIVKVNKHAQRMRNLVGELLDFRKFEQNHAVLNVGKHDMVAFLREIYLSFYDYASQRNIKYTFNSHPKHIFSWFDTLQMEKVFFNLLSNAFKYTDDGGKIEVDILQGEDVVIKIKDSGVGINPEEINSVFDRFYQAGNQAGNSARVPGTGIGLALTKSIVEKHRGEISVTSNLGKGSSFEVRLLLGKKHFAGNQHVRFVEDQQVHSYLTDTMPIAIDLEEKALPDSEMDLADENDDRLHTLLIVEDNEDLIDVLSRLFRPYYRIEIAHNGKEGLEKTELLRPDLIISDVMMPVMTGMEMCLQLKNNIDFCHIPIVLLTALNTGEKYIEGINRGADDYVTKPFNAKILLARCNNLIRNRLLIRQQFAQKSMSEIDLTTISPLDSNLLRRTVQIIDDNIHDPEFDIPHLCRELGYGRTSLYVKFKELTGMTPNSFLLNHKMKRAAVMLRDNPELTITEIADQLGFLSTTYFSRCFKSQFNMSPQSFRKEDE